MANLQWSLRGGLGYLSGATYLINKTLRQLGEKDKHTEIRRLRVLYQYLGLCLSDLELENKCQPDIDEAKQEATDMYIGFREKKGG